jgi:hypothetical protein
MVKTKKSPVRKAFKTAAKQTRKTAQKATNNLVKLIKKVSLKQTETKYAHVSAENVQLYHNTGQGVYNLINTTQGITDTGGGTSVLSNRIGDEVIARGISMKLWVANKLDRPNVMYRMFIFKYQALNSPSVSSLFKTGSGNKIMDDIDKEYVTIVYQKIFNLQVGYSAYPNATINGDTDGREAHVYKQIWIPLKDKKIHYADGAATPKFFNYGFVIVPYDSYGTLLSDNISSFTYQYKFYFKDP